QSSADRQTTLLSCRLRIHFSFGVPLGLSGVIDRPSSRITVQLRDGHAVKDSLDSAVAAPVEPARRGGPPPSQEDAALTVAVAFYDLLEHARSGDVCWTAGHSPGRSQRTGGFEVVLVVGVGAQL